MKKIMVRGDQCFLGLECPSSSYSDVFVVPSNGKLEIIQSGKKVVIHAAPGSIVGGSNLSAVERCEL